MVMEPVETSGSSTNWNALQVPEKQRCGDFKMPLHYPRYTAADYEMMPEWKLDVLLSEYGLPATGGVDQKRKFAMGAFLWHQ